MGGGSIQTVLQIGFVVFPAASLAAPGGNATMRSSKRRLISIQAFYKG
jgi:hypothetical protein